MDSFSTATLELLLLHTGSALSLSKIVTLIQHTEGVIQKDPLVPVVNNARAVVAQGTGLRQNRYDDDDEFDI